MEALLINNNNTSIFIFKIIEVLNDFAYTSFYTCGMNVPQLWNDCLTRVEYSFDTCRT